MKKLAFFIFLVIIMLMGAYLFFEKKTTAPQEQEPSTVKTQSKTTAPCSTALAKGRYINYSETVLDKECSGYSKTILFFYAPWCPECRGFDKAIVAGTIPDGIQILKVDYDSQAELKKKYGVTIQTTFVSIDTDGEKVKLWTGYGAKKSLDLVLENT